MGSCGLRSERRRHHYRACKGTTTRALPPCLVFALLLWSGGRVCCLRGLQSVFLFFFSSRFRCWESPPPPGPPARLGPFCASGLMTLLEEVWCELCFLRQAASRVKSLPAAAAAGAEQLEQTQCETLLFLAVDQRVHISFFLLLLSLFG